jgi:hypothetical protein
MPTIINYKIVFMTIAEREGHQITGLDERGEYFRFSEGSLFSGLHKLIYYHLAISLNIKVRAESTTSSSRL